MKARFVFLSAVIAAWCSSHALAGWSSSGGRGFSGFHSSGGIGFRAATAPASMHYAGMVGGRSAVRYSSPYGQTVVRIVPGSAWWNGGRGVNPAQLQAAATGARQNAVATPRGGTLASPERGSGLDRGRGAGRRRYYSYYPFLPFIPYIGGYEGVSGYPLLDGSPYYGYTGGLAPLDTNGYYGYAIDNSPTNPAGDQGGPAPTPPPASQAPNGPVAPAAKQPAAPTPAAPDSLVQEVQAELARRGYLSGNATGVFSPETGAALRRFQSDMQLRVTGLINQATLYALGLN